MKIVFVGTGYVGLVSGVMVSHIGHNVTCIDVDKKKIDLLKENKAPIFEPGLDDYIKKYGNTDRLQFLYNYDQSISDADCVFITVGTPSKDDGSADLRYIFESVESICKYVKSECLIIIKSTVPPGTCLKVKEFIRQKGYHNEVGSNPEFLREGAAIEDFLYADRIVIGAEKISSIEKMRNIYKPLLEKNQKIELVETDLNSSELIKYASNSFLANKIAFINEIADLCEIVDADIDLVSKAMGLDKRIGSAFLKAGPGFGGSCFPKDILALQKLTQDNEANFLILDAIIKANNNRPNIMLEKIKKALNGDLANKKIAVLGLTYKAGTDDLRSSPAIDIINRLKENNANIVAYDPEGMVNIDKYFNQLDYVDNIYQAAQDSDAIVICTEWPQFKDVDLVKLRELVKSPVIIDLRNIFQAEELKKIGFSYYSIGKKSKI